MRYALIKFLRITMVSGLLLGALVLIHTSCNLDMECTQGEQQVCGSSDKGLCRMGFQLCNEHNKWSDCLDSIEPSEETCDGKNNDCDVETDEITAPCNTRCGVEGVAACIDGNWSCSVVSPDEICGDNIDNDCDGSADEGCNCTHSSVCGIDTGECKTGTQYCWDNLWTECIDAQGPSTEIFDCKDNDCDGNTDEDIIGTACQDNCGLVGIKKCENGIPVCEVNDPPPEQICPDDCGIKKCINGHWTACQGGKPIEPEICDGHDNNCDGVVDNVYEPCKKDCQTGLPCTEGIYCKSGYKTCNSDCNIGPIQAEICNNQDDNCDGNVDENITGTDCSTACGAGTITCANGIQTCSAPPVLAETCNGKDDNCDGKTDNAPGGGPLTAKCSVDCGAGVIVPGLKECHDANWSECKPVLKPCPF